MIVNLPRRIWKWCISPVTRFFLRRRISRITVERSNDLRDSTYCHPSLLRCRTDPVNLAKRLRALKIDLTIEPGDEVWWWSNSIHHWRSLAGSAGYALVRNDRIIYATIVRMN